MSHDILIELSLVLALALGVSFIMRALRQPLIVGYILTGIIAGPSLLNIVTVSEAFTALSEFGVVILLFVAGLSLNIHFSRHIRKAAMGAAVLQLSVISIVGFGLSWLFGLTPTESILVAMTLSISSTIIVVKLLSDQHERHRLFAKITLALLLIEDVIAAALLFIVAAAGQEVTATLGENILLLVKGAALIGFLIFVAKKAVPHIINYFAKSHEFLFITAIAWGVGVAGLFDLAGFSVEIGALFAGLSLAGMPYIREVTSRLVPIRDFFLVIFFVAIGQTLYASELAAAIIPAILLAAVVILIKPLLIMLAIGLVGYTKTVRFKTGIYLGQISEFSLIIILLAEKNSIVGSQALTIVTLVALLTIGASTYMIKYSNQLFKFFETYLFQKRLTTTHEGELDEYKIAVFGYRKGGQDFIRALKRLKQPFVVIDHNPDNINSLEEQKVDYLYGDAADEELLSELDFKKVKMVVSTINHVETNLKITQYVHSKHPRGIIICHAETPEEALALYDAGATYVMMPQYIGGEEIAKFIRRNKYSKVAYRQYREQHLAHLRQLL